MEEVQLAEEGTPLAEFQKERTHAISEMFENKYANGIYPTSKFFMRLDNCVANLLSAEKSRLKEVITAMKSDVTKGTNSYDVDRDSTLDDVLALF